MKWCIAFLLLALTACGHKSDPDTDEPSIVNFHEVATGLYRSGSVTEAGYSALHHTYFVAGVLSLDDYSQGGSSEQEAGWAREQTITFQWYPMSGLQRPTKDQLYTALWWIDKLPKPLLVHCRLGSDRTGLVIAAYRMKRQGWSYDAAVEEMKRYGHSPALFWWDSVLKEM